ncbi:AAA family ATPase [Nocardioides sp. MAH-18]|uniref:AAA family ATPase n=1 Tax=Nocardioides agri TaxID=2682843 RepID=A0A6L6XQA7_9ACTN|nr:MULTISPECIES: BTAD domain-containing putative transcriptional regulator [unclassified Nocardioides]MBA2954612.1 AAA family ATPase [Nocardioides sp. CGMCC 1.13656]MVQ49469.1 AAA family ATPase [Nocardioides sp. MAH-18]
MDDALRVGLLGPFEVRVHGAPCGPGGSRRRGVLALLATRPNVVHPVSSIVDSLWGDDPPASAVNLIQTYVSAWRKALGEAGAALTTVGGGYELVLAADQSDLATFRELVAGARARPVRAAADALLTALDLWRGPALADLAGEVFHAALAQPLEAERVRVTELWAEAALAAGDDPDQVVSRLHDLQVSEPLRESTAALVMWAHTIAGRQAVALSVYDEMRRRLDEELGTIPGHALQDMHGRILRADPSLLPQMHPRADVRAVPLAVRQDVAPADRFFGREDELAALARLVEVERLVTLTGPGGSGKTRLAHEVLQRHRAIDQPGFFVELAPVRETALASSAVAAALGLGAAAGTDPADMLIDRLAEASGLLVLDNAEHLPGVAAFIRRLHRGCRHLHLLVTSREPLQVESEHRYAISALPVPATTELDHVVSQASVQLFMDRVQSHEPSFRVTQENAEDVTMIVRHLDGLPLAIEIVAPWMRLHGPAGLLQRLTRERLDLPGRRLDTDLRHRTLRETIAWSHDLITEPERVAFRRLAVFPGPFGLDAAGAVCTGGSGRVDEVLLDLVDRNLVQATAPIAGQPRFGMLAVVREFALERLSDHPADSVAHDRMLDWYANWAARLAGHSEGPEAPGWQALAVAEADNLRAAIEHCSELGRDSDLLQLVVDAMALWFEAGHEQEGEERLRRSLERAGPTAPARAIGLTYWAWLRATRDRQGAAAAALEARDLAVAAGDVPVEAFALQTLGDSVQDPREAETASLAALTACDRAEHSRIRYGPTAPDAVRCGASASIATCWTYRSLPEALRWQSEALRRAELEGDRRITAVNCARLARLHLLAGERLPARTLLDRAHALLSSTISARWEDTVALADADLARHESRDDDAERILRSTTAGAVAAGRVLHALLGAVALTDLYLDTGRSSEATATIDRAAERMSSDADPVHAARVEVRRARIDREQGSIHDARRRLDAVALHIEGVQGMPPERSLWLLEVAALSASTAETVDAAAKLRQLEAGLFEAGLRLPPWERARADSVARAVAGGTRDSAP